MRFSGWWARATPLKNMKVNWDDEIPNIWENKIDVPNHQPVLKHPVHCMENSNPHTSMVRPPAGLVAKRFYESTSGHPITLSLFRFTYPPTADFFSTYSLSQWR